MLRKSTVLGLLAAWAALAVAGVAAGVSTAETLVPCAEAAPVASGPDPGALLEWRLDNMFVGLKISELDQGYDRDRAASLLLQKNDTFWQTLAMKQAIVGQYRKQFNIAFTSGGSGPGGQLPYPPTQIWEYTFKGPAHRRTVNGIEFVGRNYSLHAVVVTDYYSPKLSDPALNVTGGVAHVVVELPIDPILIIQRSGSACAAEQNYAIDISNMYSHSYDPCIPEAMYVDYCTADFARPLNATEHECNYCHCTFPRPALDCVQALDTLMGHVTADYTFTALPWNATKAAEWTFEPLGTPAQGANLMPLPTDGHDTNEIYKYVPCGTAEDVEGMVSKCRWNKVAMYDSADVNNGRRPMHIGALQFHFDENDEPTYPFLMNGEFIYQRLHGHAHFYSYVQSNVTDANGTVWQGHEKLGFCVVSVNRAVNAIWSPLYNPYWNCTYQGIAPGWFDVYQRGIPGQWKDTTSYAVGTGQRVSYVNFQAQLCEGTSMCYANGTAAIDPVSTVTSCAPGFTDPVTNSTPWCVPAYRQQCSHLPTESEAVMLADNRDEAPLVHHACGESYVTDPDNPYGRDLEIGPMRDSGFALIDGLQLRYCTPGATVRLGCSLPRDIGRRAEDVRDAWATNATAPSFPGQQGRRQTSEVVRVCESSRELGCGTACRFTESVQNVMVRPGNQETLVEFTCPAARDAIETGGAYSLYRAAVMETLANAPGGIAQCRVLA